MAASMSSAESLKTEIEELERKFKSTKRRYRRSILKAKISIKRFAHVRIGLHGKVEGVRIGLHGKVEGVRIGLHGKVEDAIHGSIERIRKPGFRHEESLTKIYSMIDKSSYILKVKPSKILMAKYYLTRTLSGFANSLTRFKTFLISKLSPPPILYSKSYPLSMIELRFWYTGVYQRLARKPKGFKDAFICWKSNLGNYKVKIENSIRRNKNATKRFFD
jgi:acylphosphatase